MHLAEGFPPVSEEEWAGRAEAGLKGRPLALLGFRTLDGIEVRPVYPRAKASAVIDLSGRPAALMQRIDIADPAAANARALEDLENGASGLALVLERTPSADDLRRLLDGVELDLIAIRLDPGEGARDTAGLLLDLYASRGLDLARCDLALGLHPLSAMAARGHLVEEAKVRDAMAGMARRVSDAGFAGTAFLADTRAWHAAGATEAQELALALADAVAMIRWMDQDGIGLKAAAGLTGFLVTADADQFLTIAKLRALRLLWARVREAMDVEAKPAAVHVETAWRMLSRRDPHVNLLRTATAAFSAITGGADSVTVLPYTAASGEADGFARRMARNILMLLTEESGVGRVADPAAGSGYVEALTLALAEKAWAGFQEIEREGGLYASLRSGAVQQRIAEAAARRRAAVATRKIPITGVSEFPNLNEPPLPSPSGEKESVESLPRHRLSEPFERLCDAADAFAARKGARPIVYLATLGSLAEHGARAAWIENLLAAGGIAAQRGPATIDGFKASGATVACLCGSDAAYEAGTVEMVRALKEAGAREVLLAGRPREQEGALKSAGLDGMLHAGEDVLDALGRLHAALGISGGAA